MDMTDLYLEWNSDFAADSTGDLYTVDGDDEVRQRLERRLFTAANGGYVFHKDYGAGLPQKIGSVLTVTQIQAVCRSQLALEASVATNPPAQLTISRDDNDPSLTVIGIKYWDAKTGVAVSFTITA